MGWFTKIVDAVKDYVAPKKEAPPARHYVAPTQTLRDPVQKTERVHYYRADNGNLVVEHAPTPAQTVRELVKDGVSKKNAGQLERFAEDAHIALDFTRPYDVRLTAEQAAAAKLVPKPRDADVPPQMYVSRANKKDAITSEAEATIKARYMRQSGVDRRRGYEDYLLDVIERSDLIPRGPKMAAGGEVLYEHNAFVTEEGTMHYDSLEKRLSEEGRKRLRAIYSLKKYNCEISAAHAGSSGTRILTMTR